MTYEPITHEIIARPVKGWLCFFSLYLDREPTGGCACIYKYYPSLWYDGKTRSVRVSPCLWGRHQPNIFNHWKRRDSPLIEIIVVQHKLASDLSMMIAGCPSKLTLIIPILIDFLFLLHTKQDAIHGCFFRSRLPQRIFLFLKIALHFAIHIIFVCCRKRKK